MIATLSGKIAEKFSNMVVLDVNGLGYGVLVASEDHEKLLSGTQAKLYIYEHIRENTHDLYGFISLDVKELFEQLLEVNGVGPKMALNVLSIGDAGEVRKAIAAGDTKFITAATGVGKRVAERIIVDLKDKVGLLATAGNALFTSDALLAKDEATQALISLGYSPYDAQSALLGVDTKLPTEERVKRALKSSVL